MKPYPRYAMLMGLLAVLILFRLNPIFTAPRVQSQVAFASQEGKEQCRIEVTLISIQLMHNYYVGEEWSYWTAVDGVKKSISLKDLPTPVFQKTIEESSARWEVKAIAQEKDEHPDIGSESELVKIACPPEPNKKVSLLLQLPVKVKENNVIFAGFSALWKFEFEITAATTLEKMPKPKLKKVKVDKVIDGDTILVQMDDQTEVVRYAGIDVPQSERPIRPGECYGEEAFRYNRELVSDRTLWLKFDVGRRDQYGRLLAYAFTSPKVDKPENTLVNALLVAQGYAKLAASTPNRQYELLFVKLQEEARASGKGLWCECEDINCFPGKTIAAGINITKIKYLGIDETVTIKNESREDIDISGWELQSLDRKGEEIRAKAKFPENCIFPHRGMLRVHSGPAALGKFSSNCGQITIVLYPKWKGVDKGFVWDDTGGVARLINQNGNLIARYKY